MDKQSNESPEDKTFAELVDLHVKGDLKNAEAGYRQLIAQQSKKVEVYSNLAAICLASNRAHEAAELLHQAIEINPNFLAAHRNLALCLKMMGNLPQYFLELKKITELNPSDAKEHFHLACIYTEYGKQEEAISEFQKAIQIKTDFAEAYNNLAILYAKQGNLDEAIQLFKKAIQVEANYPAAHINLANTYKEQGQLDKAIEHSKIAFELNPKDGHALGQYWHLRQQCCDWLDKERMCQQLKDNLAMAGGFAVPPFTVISALDNPELERIASAKYIALNRPPRVLPQLFFAKRLKSDQIKVAYLSADFHSHATAYLMTEIFERHRHSKIEAHAFSFGPIEDSPMRKRLEKAFFAFHEVGNLTDKQIAALIASFDIDIAVDLKGYTRDSRPNILAYRPAPIQVNFLGYPGTMAADFIDYIIADPYIIPPEAQAYYSEKIAYLPDSYQPNDRKRFIAKEKLSRKDCGLPKKGFIFCSFNQSYKISPEIFAIWMRLLKKIKYSVLWLFESNQWATQNLQKAAKTAGVHPSRLIFASVLPLEKHLARLQHADLFLDTFPCNAHTTASDALWVGLPLVTLSGRSFSSRVAGSLLTAVGLPELITHNLKDYEVLAAKLSANPQKLKALKDKLAQNRLTSPLFDSERFEKNLVIAYERMLENWKAFKKPESFYVALSRIEVGASKPEQKGVEIESNDPQVFWNLANVCKELGKLDEAIAAFQKVIELKADSAQAYNNLGLLYKEQGLIDKAICQLEQAIQFNANYAEAYNVLAALYAEKGQVEQAKIFFQKAIQIKPDYADAFNNLGIIYSKTGYLDKAASLFQQAIQFEPTYVAAYNNLGIVYSEKGILDKALNLFEKAIQLKANYAEAYNNIGEVYRKRGLPDKAWRYYQKAYQLDIHYGHALGQYWHHRQQCCDWSEQNSMYQQMEYYLSNNTGPKDCSIAAPPFSIITVLDNPKLQLKAVKNYILLKNIDLSNSRREPRQYLPTEKIKVGYLSADFHEHATAYLMAEVFELHRNSNIEAHAFSFGPKEDSAMSKRLREAFFSFHEVGDMRDQAIAEQIAKLGIDILVDLKGYTKDSRPNIMAYRPAPIQVNFLGYPGTMGSDCIDYIIADPYLIPKAEQQYYTEKIVYLPDCYQPNDRKRLIAKELPSRKEAGLPENGFVFCSFNQTYKISPEVFAIWMRLLHQIKGSVLWLLDCNSCAKDNLRREAVKACIDPSRLIFANPLPLDKHLSRMQLADLFLDTFPCNAHTTASDALWVGLPLLTCSGRSFVSRVAGSLLTAVGLAELICHNFKEYEDLALDLAQNPEKLTVFKDRLVKNRLTTALFDSVRYENNLRMAYAMMMERLFAGKKPASFYVGVRPDGKKT